MSDGPRPTPPLVPSTRDTYLHEGRTDLQAKLAGAYARIQELEDHQYAYSTTYNFDTSGVERKKISGLERVLFSTLSRLKALLIQLEAVDAGRERIEVMKPSVEQADGCDQYPCPSLLLPSRARALFSLATRDRALALCSPTQSHHPLCEGTLRSTWAKRRPPA